jgi:hypothetical protein
MDYRYEFPADDLTRQSIQNLSEAGWRNVFDLILKNKSIDYDIDFTELNPIDRLKQLFDFVYTFRLDQQQLFQKVLVSVLNEEFEKAADPDLNFILIKVVDYVRPSKYYASLENLVTNVTIKPAFVGPDGYNLHFHLINAVMPLDLDHNLYPYLRSLSVQAQLPEFYQIAIRYLFMQLDQKAFDDFMVLNFDNIRRQEICDTVIRTFDEYAFYKKSFILIFNWLIKYGDLLQDKHEEEFRLFVKKLETYLIDLREENQGWVAFYPLLYLTKSYLPGFKMISQYFMVLQEQSTILMPAIADLYFRLGQMDGLAISKDGVCFSDDVTILLKEDTRSVKNFVAGYRLVNAPFYRKISKTSLMIQIP